MNPPPDSGGTSPHLPHPPFTVDVLADLHAGVLPDDVAAHVRAHLDDHDRTVLAALDRTRDDLRHAPVDPLPMPDHVRAMTDHTLASIAAEVAASNRRPPPAEPEVREPLPAEPDVRQPLPIQPPVRDSDQPVDLAQRRRRRGRWIAGGAGLAAAAAIAVVLALSVGLWRPAPSSDQPVVAQPGAPSSNPVDSPLSGADRVAMLSVFGKTDAAPFGSEDRLRRCTAANGVPDDVAIVGSGPVTVSGRAAVVILLGTDVAGQFTALLVGPDCDTDSPSTISRTELGR